MERFKRKTSADQTLPNFNVLSVDLKQELLLFLTYRKLISDTVVISLLDPALTTLILYPFFKLSFTTFSLEAKASREKVVKDNLKKGYYLLYYICNRRNN